MSKADIVFLNGKVATVDKDFTFRKAIAVKNGWIIDVGENDEIKPYIGTNTNVIDLGGKVILPGAHDAHIHALNKVFNDQCVDVGPEAVSTLSDLRNVLATAVEPLKKGEWLHAVGFNGGAIEGYNESDNPVTCRDIDEVVPDNPTVITDWSGHGILVNSKAMEVCGITKDTPAPDGGKIGRNAEGKPNGVFIEPSSTALITQHVPRWDDERLSKGILAAQKMLNMEGYTSYTDAAVGPAMNVREAGAAGERAIYCYKKLQAEGKLTARVSLGLYSGISGLQSYEYLKHDLTNFDFPEFDNPDWLEMKMIKVFCDGVHIFHTAWVKDEYTDLPGSRGRSCLCGAEASEEEQIKELHAMIELAHQSGYQLGVHAIGDFAVKITIDGFVNAMQKYPRENPRHYVIHADVMGDNEDLLKAAKFGIGVSAQPNLADHMYEKSITCIGKKGKRIFGLKEMLDLGVKVAGGSDTYSGEFPLWRKGVQSAVTRRSGITGKIYSPELALNIEEAVRLFTINGAYQEGKENVRGSIEVNKVADFQVLDKDIFEVDHEEIGDIQVVMTMVDGKIVYQQDGAI